LELANGCMALAGIDNNSLRFLVAGIMLSMGGFCVWMQTKAVFQQLKLSRYIKGRFLHCFIAFLLSLLTLPILSDISTNSLITLWVLAGFIGLFLYLILRKRKKAVAFCDSMMYNSV